MEAGGTVREHMERAAQPGKLRADAIRAKLDAHPCPPVFAPLYRDFLEMGMWRGSGGFGPSPLTPDVVEFHERRVRGRPYLPGELRLVKRLDTASLADTPKKTPDA
jgi:hypothetical protein